MGRIVELTPHVEIEVQKESASMISQELDVMRKLGVLETFCFTGTQEEGDKAFEEFAMKTPNNLAIDKVPDFLMKGIEAKIEADGQTDAFRKRLEKDGQ